KAEPGASWNQKEVQVLPENRLGIVLFALMCAMFLAALDQTIVATALPTIAANIGGGNSYSWVGSAYMLAGGAFGPLYGKLCGWMENIQHLLRHRTALGYGIVNEPSIENAIVLTLAMERYLKPNKVWAFVLACRSGNLCAQKAERKAYRTCWDYRSADLTKISRPTGGLAAVLLFVFLNVNPHPKRPLRDQVAELDFIGLFGLVAGAVCLLIGFNFGQTSWSDSKTISLLVVGVVLLIVAGINEIFTTRSAILPARLFKTRTTGIILITGFLHAILSSFVLSRFECLPFYCIQSSPFLVLGSSATGAGVRMLPPSVGAPIASIAAGIALSKSGKYRVIMWASYAAMTLGMGLLITLDYTSSDAEKEIFPLIGSLGIGCLFQIPLVALQAAMPLKDMATASSAYMFLRTVGGAIALAIGEAIISTVLPKKLAGIPNISSLAFGDTAAALNDGVSKIHLIPDVTLRNAVLHAWCRSIATIWMMCSPASGLALILSLFLRAYTLNRKTVQSSDAETAGDDEEATETSSVKDEE
ncbi:hypothetical protein PAXINDRAFT_27707, partial [Paxillus involutus ATCC 200175]